MYLSYYGLKKQPFHITPDPEFLYLSPSHKEALAAIVYGIEEKKGFVAITGAVGVGKTTILRSYLEKAERQHLKIVYVFNSRVTFKGLLKTIYNELGLALESDDALEMVNRLYEFLIEEYKQGNTVVLVIDEAQNMPLATLEGMRMLSNLETTRDKLIQIVMVGQPEFEKLLNTERLRQLRQRVAIRATIYPLNKKESYDYITSRLRRAGANPEMVMTPGAIKKVMGEAKGVPRLLNILCDNTLITGFGYQQKPVGKKIVREIIRDFKGQEGTPSFPWRYGVAVAGACVVLAALWFLADKTVFSGNMEKSGGQRTAGSATGVIEKRPVAATVDNRVAVDAASVVAVREKADVPKEATKVVTHVVSRGDSLSKLTQKMYGNSDSKTLKLVQQGNPSIVDPNVIVVGSTITFPVAERKEGTVQK